MNRHSARRAKVSIILPIFHRADTIVRAIRSVQAQSWQNWELIVVDDGSTDGTAALIAGMDPRMVLIRRPNRGFTEARNTAIRAACGEYCAFIDSDDEFLPHHLELCVAFLDRFDTESFLSTELLEDFGHGRHMNHYRTQTADWYPRKAALIGAAPFAQARATISRDDLRLTAGITSLLAALPPSDCTVSAGARRCTYRLCAAALYQCQGRQLPATQKSAAGDQHVANATNNPRGWFHHGRGPAVTHELSWIGRRSRPRRLFWGNPKSVMQFRIPKRGSSPRTRSSAPQSKHTEVISKGNFRRRSA